MKYFIILMAFIAIAYPSSAQSDLPARDNREVYRLLRTETRPVELIDTYMDYSRIVFEDRDFAPPPPEGFPWEVAERRIADNPALYAPEIRRRLLDVFPDRIENADQLAALAIPHAAVAG